MKNKVLLILALALTLSACSKEEYVSQRHPEENKNSKEISTDVKFENKKEDSKEKEASLKKTEEENKTNEKQNNEKNQVEKDTEEETNQAQQAYGVFTVGDISNIRSETNADSEIVAQIEPGDILERSEIVGDWSKVSYGEYEGYILTELLEESNE